MIQYTSSLDSIEAGRLVGFFVRWPNPPSPETHLRILQGSQRRILAIDEETGQVVGFVTALTDGVLSAYLPLLEVLPQYRARGIGSELVRRLLEDLGPLYMVDLTCDAELAPFYARLGLTPTHGMAVRRYDRQAGR